MYISYSKSRDNSDSSSSSGVISQSVFRYFSERADLVEKKNDRSEKYY